MIPVKTFSRKEYNYSNNSIFDSNYEENFTTDGGYNNGNILSGDYPKYEYGEVKPKVRSSVDLKDYLNKVKSDGNYTYFLLQFNASNGLPAEDEKKKLEKGGVAGID